MRHWTGVVAAAGLLVLGTVQAAFEGPPQPAGEPAKSVPPGAAIKAEVIEIGKGDGKFSCYFAHPAGDKPAPGLILIHEWWGLNDWVRRQADRFARQGYAALAVDLYRGEVAKDAEHAHELMRGLADERAVADLKAAFELLAGDERVRRMQLARTTKSIGVIGWCMGGGFALKLAIAEPRLGCSVVCYGKPVTDVAQLRAIKGPLLGIWGATDRGIEVEPFKKALDQAGVKHEHHIYAGAGHAFLNETNKRGYSREQAELAWEEIDRFLRVWLRGEPPPK